MCCMHSTQPSSQSQRPGASPLTSESVRQNGLRPTRWGLHCEHTAEDIACLSYHVIVFSKRRHSRSPIRIRTQIHSTAVHTVLILKQ